MQPSSDPGDQGRALLLVQDQSGPLSGAPGKLGDSEPLCVDRTAASALATILRVSALSTVDGTCYAYHGCNR